MCMHIGVMLPNTHGEFRKIAELLKEDGIAILGFSLASEGKLGLLYLLCDDHRRAFRLLRREYSSYCSEREVLAVAIDHKPGELEGVLEVLASASINIPAAYLALTSDKTALLIMEFDDEFYTREAARQLEGSVTIMPNPT